MNSSFMLYPSSVARRRGLSLIEAIVAMIIASTIFGMSVELLTLIKNETATGRDQALSAASLARLAEQFRADVHAANAISQNKTDGGLILWTMKMPDDKRVEYEPRAEGLRRTEYRDDKVHARDTFVLPATETRLELKPAEKPVEATLLIKERANGADAIGGGDLRIEAAVGRDLRFVTK
jgi:hypothetical protein